jgi:hypothetical protein
LLSFSQVSKNAVFLIIAYIFSSKKLERSAEQVVPGSEGGGREEVGGRGRNDPNNIYTYE